MNTKRLDRLEARLRAHGDSAGTVAGLDKWHQLVDWSKAVYDVGGWDRYCHLVKNYNTLDADEKTELDALGTRHRAPGFFLWQFATPARLTGENYGIGEKRFLLAVWSWCKSALDFPVPLDELKSEEAARDFLAFFDGIDWSDADGDNN